MGTNASKIKNLNTEGVKARNTYNTDFKRQVVEVWQSGVYSTTFKTRAQAQLGIFDFIEVWYNNYCIHSKLGYLTPNEFERASTNSPERKFTEIGKNLEIWVATQ